MGSQSNPIHGFFNSHRIVQSTNNEDVLLFLGELFKNYCQDLMTLLKSKNKNVFIPDSFYEILQNNINHIENLCNGILISIRTYQEGKKNLSLDTFFSILDKTEHLLCTCEIAEVRCNYGINSRFFHVRPVDNENAIKRRRDLFFIPFEKRSLVGNNRYNEPGFPTFYLSTDIFLCWLECGLPAKFSYSEFQIGKQQQLTLLDLRFPAIETVRNWEIKIFNQMINGSEISGNDEKEYVDKIIRYFTIYPLIVSTSLIVENKESQFFQEYIISQMLMNWILENKKVKGVIYSSCAKARNAKYMNAINIAIPPDGISLRGFPQVTAKIFKISPPIYVDIYKSIKEQLKPIKKIKENRNFLYSVFSQNLALDMYKELLDIYECYIEVYEKILEKETDNISLVLSVCKVLLKNISGLLSDSDKQFNKGIKGNQIKIFDKKDWIIIKEHISVLIDQIKIVSELETTVWKCEREFSDDEFKKVI